MTVPSIVSRNDYLGTGSTAVYTFSYFIILATHLQVTKTDTSGVSTTLVNGTDYVVSNVGSASGGYITLTAGNLPSGYSLSMRRVVPLTQTVDLRNAAGYFAETHESEFDYLTMCVQQLQDQLNRSLVVSETDISIANLPSKTARANKSLFFGPTGDPTVTGATSALPDSSVVLVVDTIAALKALAAPSAAVTYFVRGYFAIGDGGGGFMRWNSADTTTDNGGTIFQLGAGGNGRFNRLFDGAVNILWFGADKTGTTDAASFIQLAINSNSGQGQIFAPPGRFTIGSQISIPPGNSRNVSFIGAGAWATIFQRKSTYPAGDLFAVKDSFGSGTANLLQGFRIENANGFNNTSGAAISAASSGGLTLRDIEIWDGFGGYLLTGCANVTMENCKYLQTSGYAASYSSSYGLKITGHLYSGYFANCQWNGQNPDSANNLTTGIIINGADGAQFVNCAANGKFAVYIQGGAGISIDDIYFSNCIFDNVSTACIVTTGTNNPNVFTNIRFADCHINGGNHVGGQDGVQIGGDVDEIAFLGGNVNLCMGAGFNIGAGNNYNGVAKRSILIQGVDISENNYSNTASTHGISVAAAASGVSIQDCTIRNRTAAGHQKYGIVLGDGLANCSILNNRLIGNETGAIYQGANHTNTQIANNMGGDFDTMATVVSAASIAIPAEGVCKVSGTTAVTTITGGWKGRRIEILALAALPLNTGGNIAKAVACVANQRVTGVYDGTNWFLT